jgi:hypothetical protein
MGNEFQGNSFWLYSFCNVLPNYYGKMFKQFISLYLSGIDPNIYLKIIVP